MDKLRICCIAISLAAISLTGCATTHVQAAQANTPLPGTESCFWVRNVRHWDVLDPSTLIVYAPMAQDAFLVKLFQPIPDLSFHLSLGFDDADRTGRICSIDDYVSVGEPFPLRVPISAVRALTAEQVKQLKSFAKGKGKDNSVTPAVNGPTAAVSAGLTQG
jgi:Family of unknown function (DUF6491)